MSTEIDSLYSTQIIATISALEEQLRSITQSQNELIDAISKAQAASVTEQDLSDIKKMMDKVSLYNTKLMSIKATMSMLTGRSKQLLVKADKLKQIKLQYLSQIDKIRKMEQEKDQIIAAKTSINISTTPSTPTSSPRALSPSPITSTTSSPLITNDIESPAETVPSPILASNNSTPTTAATPTIPKIKSIVKKKKKTKAREALIGGDDDDKDWTPKRSISQKDLLLNNKKP